MSIESKVIDKAIKGIDLSSFEKEINKAVAEYVKSEYFQEDLVEAMRDEGVGYDLSQAIGKKLVTAVKKGLTISVS